MRVVYSTNVSNVDLLKLFFENSQILESNILEVFKGDYSVVRFKQDDGGKKIFTAVIKNSTVYVERLGSGMGEILAAGKIAFSCNHHAKIQDQKVEDYFLRNSYLS